MPCPVVDSGGASHESFSEGVKEVPVIPANDLCGDGLAVAPTPAILTNPFSDPKPVEHTSERPPSDSKPALHRSERQHNHVIAWICNAFVVCIILLSAIALLHVFLFMAWENVVTVFVNIA